MADENIKDDGLNVVETTEEKTDTELDPKEVKKAENEKQRKKILIISAIVAAVILIGVIVFGCYKISSDIKAKRGEIVFFNGNNMYTDGTFSDPLHSDKVDIYSARSGYVNTDGKYLYYMEGESLYYDSLNSEKENLIADQVEFFEVDKKGHIYYLSDSDLYEYTIHGSGTRNLLYNNVRMAYFDEKKERAILVLNDGTMGTLELKSSAQFNVLDDGVTYVVDYDSKLENIIYCKGNVLDVMDKKGNKLIVADSFSEVYPVDITKGVEVYYLDNSNHLYYCKSATSSKGVTDVANFTDITGIYCDMENREAFLISGTVDGVTGVYLINDGKAERIEGLASTSIDYGIALDAKAKKIYFTSLPGDGGGTAKSLYSVSYGAFKKPKAVVEQNSVDSILAIEKGKLYTLRNTDNGLALYYNNGEVVDNVLADSIIKTLDEKGYVLKYKTADGEVRVGFASKGSFKDLSSDFGDEFYAVSAKKIYMIRTTEEGARSLGVFNGKKVKSVAEDVSAFTYIHY